MNILYYFEKEFPKSEFNIISDEYDKYYIISISKNIDIPGLEGDSDLTLQLILDHTKLKLSVTEKCVKLTKSKYCKLSSFRFPEIIGDGGTIGLSIYKEPRVISINMDFIVIKPKEDEMLRVIKKLNDFE